MVEILVALGITGVVILTIAHMGQLSLRLSRLSSERTQAAIIAQEGVEAVRFLRDHSWSENIEPLTASTTYYLVFASTTYRLTTTSQSFVNNLFERTVIPYTVARNDEDDISTSGTTDTSTLQFRVNVSWRTVAATTTESVEFYLTNMFDN